MESVADFVVAGIRIIIGNTNFIAEKNNGKVNSLTYLYLITLLSNKKGNSIFETVEL
jgi:hypothetical protein